MRDLRCLVVLGMSVLLAPRARREKKPTPGEVLSELKKFFADTAQPDGSFRPGLEPSYTGLSDSAYSDFAPVTYAVILHKTFGWTLPHEAKTRDFLLGRQDKSGAF